MGNGRAPASLLHAPEDAVAEPARATRADKLDSVLAALNGSLRPLAALSENTGERPPLPFGQAQLDQALGGGLRSGMVFEFSGPVATVGLSGLQRQLLRSAREAQIFTALIDAFDRFDVETCPPELRASLLWVRGQGGVPQALKAADLLTRDPNFGLLLLDLREAEVRALRRIPAQQWYRLQRTVRDNRTTLLAFTAYPVIPSATTRIEFSQARGGQLHWSILRANHSGALLSQASAM